VRSFYSRPGFHNYPHLAASTADLVKITCRIH